MKTIKEILILIRDEFDNPKNKDCIHNGFCSARTELRWMNKINAQEYNLFDEFYEKAVKNRTIFWTVLWESEKIKINDCENKLGYYLFKSRDKTRRLKWINKHIDKL